jgi:parallel beta-helix repeat protein
MIMFDSDLSIVPLKISRDKQLFGTILIAIATLLTPSNLEGVAANDSVVAEAANIAAQNIIYVDPQQGNDSQNQGSRESPLKTLTQALKQAKAGTTIKLAAGTYSVETGESFPLIIREKVTIEGSVGSQGYNTIIRGDGYFISHTGAGQNVTIAAIKNAGEIAGVTVSNPHNRGHGLWIESANPKVIGNTFTRNGNTGVSVNGNSSPTIANNYFYNNNGNGLLIYDDSQAQVNGNVFEKTGFGVSIVQNAIAVLTGNRFSGNRIGIILENAAQGTLRDNQIETSIETGLVAISQSRVDLGTIDNPGNNIFRNNHKLDIQNASSNSIVAVGTQISSNIEGNIDFTSANHSPVTVASVITPPSSSDIRKSENRESGKNFDRVPRSLILENQESPNPSRPIDRSPNQAISESPKSLSAPPPIEANDSGKELVFSAPQSRETLPVPKEIKPPVSQETSIPENLSTNINSSSPIVNSPNSREISSLSDVLGNANLDRSTYRVLVEAGDTRQQRKVRSLYPQAFATVYRGKSVLQIGAFSDLSLAQTASQSLKDLGLNTYILE